MTRRAVVLVLAPIVLALLVMLPRLASPQFGLLDDGLTLQTGREVIGRWSRVLHLIPETGRFFPAHWLVNSAIVGIVGVRPLAFFTANVLVLAGLLAAIARLVRLAGGARRHAVVAAVLFAVSGPTVESFYTLSKPEPLQLTWIALSLFATAASAVETRWPRRAGLMTLAAATVLLAHATKETSVVLVPIAVGWLGIEWWSSRERSAWTRFAGTYAAVTVVGAIAFAALRWFFAPLGLGEGTYTRAYTVASGTVGGAFFRIIAWLLRDFAFLAPLLAVAAVSVVRGKPASRRPLLYACVWMAGWLGVYLPWPATFEYYLLPFAFGASVLGGMVVGDLWAARGRVAWGALVAGGLLWLPAIVNAAGDARVQLAVDAANAGLVDFLATAPRGSHVAVNIPRTSEYLAELPLHLAEISRRPDVVVEALARARLNGPLSAPVFVATPEMVNEPSPTVRIALDEPGVRRDNAMLPALLSARDGVVYRSVQHVRVVEVGLHRLLCLIAVSRPALATYCPRDRGLLHHGTFSYGWQVYRLVRSPGGGEARRDG